MPLSWIRMNQYRGKTWWSSLIGTGLTAGSRWSLSDWGVISLTESHPRLFCNASRRARVCVCEAWRRITHLLFRWSRRWCWWCSSLRSCSGRSPADRIRTCCRSATQLKQDTRKRPELKTDTARPHLDCRICKSRDEYRRISHPSLPPKFFGPVSPFPDHKTLFFWDLTASCTAISCH